MYHTGLADPYYYEQYVGKPDFVYELERTMLMVNYNSPDTSKTALNLLTSLKH